MTWVLLACAVVAEVAATLALRASEGFRDRRWGAAAVAGYLVGFVLLGQVLARGLPVGVAYGVWAASGVALTALLGRVLFAEPLTAPMLCGVVLIAGGVLMVEAGA
ncbi:multidrug efflux SMR transporter [Nocardioides sp. CFH 31398]|uniref:DMT family transporter n=1 Tax=Nocardioides sp. CFH 31398 TaxID=2919579 RepID=UPI001F053290|nr:SMR family transporter [Nocardioides sp. CFH 31398]MCH1868090.1 SMR family transporter [Nocardioides sp. CFH 31398]